MATIVQYALFALFPLAMAYAAASDLLTMTISNKLALALLAGFAVMAPVVGMDWQVVALHVAAGALVLAFGFAFICGVPGSRRGAQFAYVWAVS